jgi:hypothetical protein
VETGFPKRLGSAQKAAGEISIARKICTGVTELTPKLATINFNCGSGNARQLPVARVRYFSTSQLASTSSVIQPGKHKQEIDRLRAVVTMSNLNRVDIDRPSRQGTDCEAAAEFGHFRNLAVAAVPALRGRTALVAFQCRNSRTRTFAL